ncbi:MAG: hypothetical protein OIF54_00235 [Cohaesibacter sp.]|nr:hypothetical protein [Cohaesibacter sp.]
MKTSGQARFCLPYPCRKGDAILKLDDLGQLGAKVNEALAMLWRFLGFFPFLAGVAGHDAGIFASCAGFGLSFGVLRAILKA